MLDIPEPRVGLLSNGEERTKGNQQVLEAAKLLEAATELIRHCRLCEEFLARQTVAMTAKIYKQNPVLKKLVESEAWAKTMVPASPFTEMVQRDDKPTP